MAITNMQFGQSAINVVLNEWQLPAKLSTDDSGNTVLVGGDGQRFVDFDRYPAPDPLEIMPVTDLSMWSTDKTAALVIEVDTTVRFQGNPTLKITIPAGTSGACKVGTAIANALIPYGWDKKDFTVALMYSGFTGYDWTTTYPPALNAYFGDASYTNFWVTGESLASFPETKPRPDEWYVVKPPQSWGVGVR